MAQSGIVGETVILGAVGQSPPLPVHSPVQYGAYSGSSSLLQPGISVNLSAGAVLTYNVEVTGDNINAPGYNPSQGNWSPWPGMSGLSASAATTLGALFTAIRLNVTGWTSGSATLQFIQLF